MKVRKYNDDVTKYEVDEGTVTVDRGNREMVVKLNDGKGPSKSKTVLKRKCVVVHDAKSKTIKALCDSFHITINMDNNEATVTMY